jgi:hypothetical protein
MFISSPTNIRVTWEQAWLVGLPCDSYVHRGIDEHKTNVALGSARAYVAYVHRSGGTDERKGLRFVGST